MPMLDFPSSPVLDQEVTLGTTNLRWRWDGDGWRRVVAQAALGGLFDVIEGYAPSAIPLTVYSQAI